MERGANPPMCQVGTELPLSLPPLYVDRAHLCRLIAQQEFPWTCLVVLKLAEGWEAAWKTWHPQQNADTHREGRNPSFLPSLSSHGHMRQSVIIFFFFFCVQGFYIFMLDRS